MEAAELLQEGVDTQCSYKAELNIIPGEFISITYTVSTQKQSASDVKL